MVTLDFLLRAKSSTHFRNVCNTRLKVPHAFGDTPAGTATVQCLPELQCLLTLFFHLTLSYSLYDTSEDLLFSPGAITANLPQWLRLA